MKTKKKIIFSLIAVFVLITVFIIQKNLSAHCDTIDGPVVQASKDALEKENVNLVLIWVQKEHEKEVIEKFSKTIKARKISEEIKELADMSFFETVVRLHREGEGEPYTGIKTAGEDLSPAVISGDKAVETESIREVQALISAAVEEGLKKHFSELMEKKNYDPDNIEAGRDYVKSYVEYIHYVESLYNTAKNPGIHNNRSENTEHQKKCEH